MRLLHVASSYPLSPGDGTAPFMEEMLRPLVQRAHSVSIVVPRISGLVEGDRQGINVIAAPYAPKQLQVWGYGRSLDRLGRLRPSAVALTPVVLASMARVVRAEINRSQPDVVHLHWILPQGLLALLLPKSVPIVVSVHGADARFSTGALRGIVRRILDRADSIVAASSPIMESVTAVSPSSSARSRVIPHGANGELFGQHARDDARRELGIERDKKMVLAVGRLVPKKGFHHLIDAMPLMSAIDPLLVLVGDGPQKAQLSDRATNFVGSSIRMVSSQSRERLALWFAASDVVVVPSIQQGRDVDSGPVVVMEALATGRPVVATRIGMAPSVVSNDENGVLVDSASPEHLAAAIVHALSNSTRMGKQARLMFERVGDWSRVAEELESAYGDAIEHRRSMTPDR